jgi:molybdenum cofactor cytidylyltransferase
LNNQPNIAILILAAGNSSRMGEPKQLLPWKNTFLLNHAINTAVLLDNSKTFVVLGANYERIQSKIQRDDISIIYNANWELGLGSSIAFGVRSFMTKEHNFEGILIMLSDQPLVDFNYLKMLSSSFKPGINQIMASNYGPNTSGEKLGVPALFDTYYFEELSELNQDKGAKKVISRHIENVSTLNANYLISDIDTMEDYERLYSSNH